MLAILVYSTSIFERNCWVEVANCNRRRRLLGLNPLPDTSIPQTTGRKPKRSTGKKQGQKPRHAPEEAPTHNNEVEGLDGDQLLRAINTEDADTPIRL